MDLRFIFGKNLKYYRFKKKYTQEKLAELIDVSPNYISQLEAGLHSADFGVIEKLAEKLDIEPFQFFLEPKEHKLPRRIDMKYDIS